MQECSAGVCACGCVCRRQLLDPLIIAIVTQRSHMFPTAHHPKHIIDSTDLNLLPKQLWTLCPKVSWLDQTNPVMPLLLLLCLPSHLRSKMHGKLSSRSVMRGRVREAGRAKGGDSEDEF